MAHIVEHTPLKPRLTATVERFDELLRDAQGDPLIARGMREFLQAEQAALLQ